MKILNLVLTLLAIVSVTNATQFASPSCQKHQKQFNKRWHRVDANGDDKVTWAEYQQAVMKQFKKMGYSRMRIVDALHYQYVLYKR